MVEVAKEFGKPKKGSNGMKKKIVSTCVGMLSICMVVVSGITTYAAEMPVNGGRENIRIESFIWTTDGISQGRLPEENEAKGLFTTKYRVSVSKATMRSGYELFVFRDTV